MSEEFEYVEETSPLTEEDWKRFVDIHQERRGQRVLYTMPSQQSSDWEKLSIDQQADVTSLRARMKDALVTETEAFYHLHPELRLIWSFTFDALLRENKEQP